MDQGKFDDGSQVATLKISRDMNVEDTEYVCLVKPVNEEEMKGLVSVLISDSSSDPSSDSSSDSGECSTCQFLVLTISITLKPKDYQYFSKY